MRDDATVVETRNDHGRRHDPVQVAQPEAWAHQKVVLREHEIAAGRYVGRQEQLILPMKLASDGDAKLERRQVHGDAKLVDVLTREFLQVVHELAVADQETDRFDEDVPPKTCRQPVKNIRHDDGAEAVPVDVRVRRPHPEVAHGVSYDPDTGVPRRCRVVERVEADPRHLEHQHLVVPFFQPAEELHVLHKTHADTAKEHGRRRPTGATDPSP